MPLALPQTETDLANLALSALAEQRRLANVDTDNTAVSNAVKQFFWQAWDETIRGYPWNCVRKRAQLAALEETPAFEYDLYYQVPADYVNLQKLPDLCPGEQFNVEVTDSGVRAIACNIAAPLNLIYSYQLRNIARADPAFIGAFVAGLAFYLAMPVTKKPELEVKQFSIWQTKIRQGQRADATEGSRQPMPDPPIVTERD